MSLNSQKGPYKEPPLYDKEPKSIDPYVVVISVTFTLIFFIVFVWIIGYCVKMSMEKSKARREQSDTNNPQNYAATTNANANENYRVAVTNNLLQVCTIVYCKKSFTYISKNGHMICERPLTVSTFIQGHCYRVRIGKL